MCVLIFTDVTVTWCPQETLSNRPKVETCPHLFNHPARSLTHFSIRDLYIVLHTATAWQCLDLLNAKDGPFGNASVGPTEAELQALNQPHLPPLDRYNHLVETTAMSRGVKPKKCVSILLPVNDLFCHGSFTELPKLMATFSIPSKHCS